MTTLLTMKWFNKQIDYLCFTANTAGSTVALNKNGSPTAVTLETSTDWQNWSTYTFGSTITLSSIWDKVYWRNTSETTTWFSTDTSNYYNFIMTWSISASWDINYLLRKTSTDSMIYNYEFYRLFDGCSVLITPPKLLAVSISNYCYSMMFRNCTSLVGISELPAITLKQGCYASMFLNCSSIKLSTTQTWEYQTEYRIPIEWTGTNARDALYNMFWWTWWTFTWTPTINTTYYTSNTII